MSPSADVSRVGAAIEAFIVTSYRMTRLAGRIAELPVGSSARWRTLAVLETLAPLSISDLAMHSRVSQPTMTGLVRTLEQDGLVARALDPRDNRVRVISLTPAGRSALLEWRSTMRTALVTRFEGLDDADVAALERAAEILVDRIPEG